MTGGRARVRPPAQNVRRSVTKRGGGGKRGFLGENNNNGAARSRPSDGCSTFTVLCQEGNGVWARPLLSGWLILYPGGGGSEAKKKFVYLKLTSKFGPL